MGRGERVVTVRGEISPKNLGITLTHEHLILDCTFYTDFYGLPAERWKRRLLGQPLSLENLWIARRELFSFRDNLIVDDESLVAGDLKHYKEMRGQSLVDLTPPSLGGNPEATKRISEKTGLSIVYGCGHYIEASHPARAFRQTASDLADEFVGLIERGYGETGIRAGILGEIGTGPKITAQERKVLLATARAHRKTGAPINVHLANIKGRNGPAVARLMKEEGVKMEKLVLSHVDMMYKDATHQREVADYGVFIGFDGFGEEDYVESLDYLPPRDKERIDNIASLIDRGYLDQILLSQDICRKTAYRKYGGQGFDHLLRNIVPAMRKAGISDREIDTMLTGNPARLLAF